MTAKTSFRLIAATVLVTAFTAVASAQSNNGNGNGNRNNNSNNGNRNGVVSVPEPEMLLLFGSGLIVTFLLGRRRKSEK
jgi:PEP-CTERM motif